MAGVKGRSGRKTKSDEEKRLATIDKAWDIIHNTLHDVKVSIKTRRLLAEKIVLRDLGNRQPLVDLSNHNHYSLSIKTDDKNDRSPVSLKTTDRVGSSKNS